MNDVKKTDGDFQKFYKQLIIILNNVLKQIIFRKMKI